MADDSREDDIIERLADNAAEAEAPAALASAIDEARKKCSVQEDDKDGNNDAALHNDHAGRRLEVIENDDDAPLPTPWVAASCEAIEIDESAKKLSYVVEKGSDEASIKRSNKLELLMEEVFDENAPPMPAVGQLAASLEAAEAENESATKSSYLISNRDGGNVMHSNLEMIEGDDENAPPMPIAQLATSLEAIENEGNSKQSFLLEHTEDAGQAQPMRPPPAPSNTRLVDSFSHMTLSHPTPISTLPSIPIDSTENLIPPPFFVLEATLVDDVVYDAIPVQADDDLEQEKSHPVSWWTRLRILYALVGLALGAVAVALGIKNRSGKNTNPTAANLIWKPRGQRLVGRMADDGLGSSASLSANGNILAIGNDPNVDGPCYVRLYFWSSKGSKWEKIGNDIVNDRVDRRSGCSVSLSGDGKTLAMGSEENDESPGHVTLYSIDTASWRRLENISGESLADSFGFSVSLSDDGRTLAVGAIRNSKNGSQSGHVRIFHMDDSRSEWTQLGKAIDGESESDFSGHSVSLSADGSVVAIGSPQIENYLPGKVRVYNWKDGSRWEKRGKDLVGDQPGDNFGISVSISGDGEIVAVGSCGTGGDDRKGYARIYYIVDDDWQRKGVDLNGTFSGGAFGQRVFLSRDGSIFAVSDPSAVAENKTEKKMFGGLVRIYGFNNSTSHWIQRGSDINGEAQLDFSGRGLSLSADGKIVAIGSPYGDEGKGTMRVFSIEN